MRPTGLVLFIALVAAAPAAAQDATPLTATDFRYLKTLGETPSEISAMRPTPAMLDKLHQLINDPATAGKPKARADAVYRELDHMNAQFLWCSDHPQDKDCAGFTPVANR